VLPLLIELEHQVLDLFLFLLIKKKGLEKSVRISKECCICQKGFRVEDSLDDNHVMVGGVTVSN
jgi:hypothetical protein